MICSWGFYLKTYLLIYLFSPFVTCKFRKSPYICNAKSNVVNTAPPSTRIDAQYEIGLFLCPSVNHIVGIHELVPYTKFVDVAYAIKAFGCLSQPFLLTGRTAFDLAITGNGSRSCIQSLQENLPNTAKSNAVCYNQVPRWTHQRYQPSRYGWIVIIPCSLLYWRAQFPTVRYCSSAMLALLFRL